MSPTSLSSSAIYDHLITNYHHKPQATTRNQTPPVDHAEDESPRIVVSTSKPDSARQWKIKRRKPTPADDQNRRHTVTHIILSEPSARSSVSNQIYDTVALQKPAQTLNGASTPKEKSPGNARSPLTSNIEVKPMDFRPLIINGRRRFNTISSAAPMVIIKKKSPSTIIKLSTEQVCVE